jgi:hypothetical protein
MYNPQELTASALHLHLRLIHTAPSGLCVLAEKGSYRVPRPHDHCVCGCLQVRKVVEGIIGSMASEWLETNPAALNAIVAKAINAAKVSLDTASYHFRLVTFRVVQGLRESCACFRHATSFRLHSHIVSLSL